MGVLILTRTRAARTALLLGAGLSFVTPIWAQNAVFDAAATNAATSPLQAAISAGNTPLTLAASALDASWRRFKPGKTPDGYSYLTHGETLKVGDETFLLVYRAPRPSHVDYDVVEDDGEDYADAATNATDEYQYPPEFATYSATPDGYLPIASTQTLNLCLLNVRQVGDLNDIRAFDAKADLVQIVTIADKERASEQALAERASLSGEALNNRVSSDLKQIGLALAQYTQDYDEKLPPMRSAQSMAQIKQPYDAGKLATVQSVLDPYLQAPELFAHPTTRELYRPNLNVSGRNLANLDPAERIVTFYEASPAPDGTRAVLYLDGHVKRERETNWPAIRAASDAIAPPLKFGPRATNNNATNATVTLYDSAALAYMLRRRRDDRNRSQPAYLSKSTNRVYYRDAKTHQAIWVDPPADGITIPYEQAQEFREFQGYNGQLFGRTLGDSVADAATYTPKIKTALGANAALKGSMIDVAILGDRKTVALRGTTTSGTQKILAETIAKKNAPGFRIANQLVVQGR